MCLQLMTTMLPLKMSLLMAEELTNAIHYIYI
nr:MAG TPA: hypothetical protein [Bacteriophage sp.]